MTRCVQCRGCSETNPPNLRTAYIEDFLVTKRITHSLVTNFHVLFILFQFGLQSRIKVTWASCSALGLGMPVITTIGVPSLCGGNGGGGSILRIRNQMLMSSYIFNHYTQNASICDHKYIVHTTIHRTVSKCNPTNEPWSFIFHHIFTVGSFSFNAMTFQTTSSHKLTGIKLLPCIFWYS